METIVLIEPETPGNIGAIARSMKNFGYTNLVLIKPKTNHNTKEAKDRASHAKDVLKKTKTTTLKTLRKNHDLLIATTAINAKEYNIKRNSITPEQLANQFKNTKGKTAILFGRESTGLTNKEIETCDITVTIPTHNKYKTLNIAHAATIIMYEIHKKRNPNKTKIATQQQKTTLYKEINKKIQKTNNTKRKKENQLKTWKKIIEKSLITSKEITTLIGFFKKK